MTCPLHRDLCECPAGADGQAWPRWETVADTHLSAPAPRAGPEIWEGQETERTGPVLLIDVSPGDGAAVAPEDSLAWRKEVTARLSRYQARRKPRPPRYPSLNLRFEDQRATVVSAESSGASRLLSERELALDEFAGNVQAPVAEAFREEASPPAGTLQSTNETAQQVSSPELSHAVSHSVRAHSTAKIIEFPRSWTPPAPPFDELAEPVPIHPSVLEVPEVVPSPPALGGITIEPAVRPEVEKRLGIDIPLRGAPVGRRVLSALIDDAIVAAACALFGYIFWRLTSIRPPRIQTIGVLGGVNFLFWGIYQYLLIVYAGTTPGLRLAGLELTRFNGSAAVRRIRRWRVLASYLSAVSLGMGYAWVFLDEDSLCWHDRITHTYLAPKGPTPQ